MTHSPIPKPRAALAGLLLFTLAFAWLGREVVENHTVRFDESVRAAVHRASGPALTKLMILASSSGGFPGIGILTALAALAFLLLHRRRDAVTVVAAVIGSEILSEVLKIGFQRPRPQPFFGYPAPDSFSFPSGHALTAVCFYSVLAYLLTRRIGPLAGRIAVWTVAAAMFLLIGFSRIYLGVHYPSDVLGGYAAGAAWTAAIILAATRGRRSHATNAAR